MSAHSDIPSNEQVNLRYKQASKEQPIGPEPLCDYKKEIHLEQVNYLEHLLDWQYCEYNKPLHKIPKKASWNHHGSQSSRGSSKKIGNVDNDSSRFCDKAKEYLHHILIECEMLSGKGERSFGKATPIYEVLKPCDARSPISYFRDLELDT